MKRITLVMMAKKTVKAQSEKATEGEPAAVTPHTVSPVIEESTEEREYDVRSSC